LSCFDIVKSADKDYHGGIKGIDPLTFLIIKICGYTMISSNNVILCYYNIKLLHRKIMEGWTNICTQHRGPLSKMIMGKAMPHFKKLMGVMAADLVLGFIAK
jgi:hypothetical protein